MARLPTPTPRRLAPARVRKLEGRTATPIEGADFKVFAVQRVVYAKDPLPHDVFVFTCSDWCNVIAETDAGEIVLVWQYRFGSDAMSLEVPGGVIDPGETPEEAARRELREETGYEAATFELVSVVEPNPALQGNRCFTFLARGAREVAATAFDELEDLETTLVRPEELGALIDDGVVTHALVVVALERYLRLLATPQRTPSAP